MKPLWDLVNSYTTHEKMVIDTIEVLFNKPENDQMLQEMWELVLKTHVQWHEDTVSGKRKPEPIMGYYDVERAYVTSKEELKTADPQSLPSGLITTMQLLGPVLKVDFVTIALFREGSLMAYHKHNAGNCREVYVCDTGMPDQYHVLVREENLF